ncbi:LysR family transcriptional regulator [Variovorax sp. WS11]|uniref:DoxX family protein n=1 Tax=Variovorax sp. WS11 TaxID=1105204 RepID=UPI000D0CEAF8|nr:DoxX family protein [Variovorax sp. WS11]NDZ17499.1 DoxX family protein [Variovorax sp. WS11]PSL85968.1 LysR family transcriptional regulator [Variovorax sp. WS11]
MNTTSSNNTTALPLVGRILLAAIFVISSLGKIAAPEGTQGYIASVGLPAPVLSYIAAVVIELGGGVLLLVGYRTRLVAAGLALFSIASALIFHHALADQNQLFHFLKNLAMAGGLIQVVAYGAGAYSLDNRSRKSVRGPVAQ